MAKKIFLAFLWHHHQPYYRLSNGNGKSVFQMPWVRLHGIKDYWGMASLLKEYPKLKANFNLVPALLKQIQEYLAGDVDHLLLLARGKAAELDAQDKRFLLENSFMANPEFMIGRCPRYNELYQKFKKVMVSESGSVSTSTFNYIIKEFNTQDFLDLQVCSNLAWFHPLIMERDPELKALKKKSKGYTEDEKKFVIDRQLRYMAEIIPLHKKMQEDKQIEVTTTPFYHPILPLLMDMNSARQAMPNVTLPKVDQEALKEDARWHVAEAVKYYKELFGVDARGLWPAEGSVSPDILPLLAEQGISYFATDEEILSHSTNSFFHRDGNGLLEYNGADILYQPYLVKAKDAGGEGKDLSVVFRDQYLSNLLGFQYKQWNDRDAAEHFVNQIKANAARSGQDYPLVNVILDGENPWEHFPNNGIDFLRALYQKLSDDTEIETVCYSDYFTRYPPQKRLDSLYSGSWINHNFSIWIGDNEDCKAWEYLAKTKQAKKDVPVISKEVYEKIQENIYIAEGSDWYWWFGHEHSSVLDDQFDALFRKHLINVYNLLGINVPEYLYHQIKEKRQKELFSQPVGLLQIKLDGRRSSYFEWLGAGYYDVAESSLPGAAMDQSARDLISRISYGFSAKGGSASGGDQFCLRLDPSYTADINQMKVVCEKFPTGIYFVLNFLKPNKIRVIIYCSNFGNHQGLPEPEIRPGRPTFSIYDENNKAIQEGLESVAIDEVVEVLCPLDLLGLKPKDEMSFFVEVYQDISTEAGRIDKQGSRLLARYPDSQPVKLTVPEESIETEDWTA